MFVFTAHRKQNIFCAKTHREDESGLYLPALICASSFSEIIIVLIYASPLKKAASDARGETKGWHTFPNLPFAFLAPPIQSNPILARPHTPRIHRGMYITEHGFCTCFCIGDQEKD
jgi:hypothetical protein